MAMTSWIKTFGKLVLADFGSVPSRLCRHVWATLVIFLGFYFRKAHEEKGLFFKLLFMPVTIILMISSEIKAYRRGLSLSAFLKLERAELEAEAEVLKQEICRERIKSMERLVSIMPGATVNDYEDLIERRPFRSLMFLRNGLWKLILGDNNKK